MLNYFGSNQKQESQQMHQVYLSVSELIKCVNNRCRSRIFSLGIDEKKRGGEKIYKGEIKTNIKLSNK